MKKITLIFFSLNILLFSFCKKKEYNQQINTNSNIDSNSNQSNLPTIKTLPPTQVTYTTSVVGGDSILYNKDTITSIGICWGTTSDINISNSIKIQQDKIEPFTYKIVNLTPNTTYYYRAYATSKIGTGYGKVLSFTTLNVIYNKGKGVNDIEGNFYRSVIIGNQEWMIDNLKVSKFNDGTEIPIITDNNNWYINDKEAYCIYENKNQNKSKYGLLYNGYAVETKKLCPTNWHVPSKEEWDELITFCGGPNIAGGKLKEISYEYWVQPNTDATNIAGFNGVGSGLRTNNGSFFNLNKNGYWWSSSNILNSPYPQNYYVVLSYANTNIYTEGYYKQTGLSVRCIKND